MPIYKIPNFKPVIQTVENGHKSSPNKDFVNNNYRRNGKDYQNPNKSYHENNVNMTAHGSKHQNINSNISQNSLGNHYPLHANQTDKKYTENKISADEGLYESIIEKEVKEQIEREKEVALMRNLNIALEKQHFLESSPTTKNLKETQGKEIDYSPISSNLTDASSCSGYYTLESSRLTSPEAPCRDKPLFESKLFKKRVMPLEEVQKKTIEPQEESLLEREVRLAREREGSLRRARGHLLKVHDDPHEVTISTQSKNKKLSFSDQLDGSTNRVKNSQTFATNRLRNEILKDKQRELNLKNNAQEIQGSTSDKTFNDNDQNNTHSQKIKYFDTKENFNNQNGRKLTANSNYYKNVLQNKKATREDRTIETRMEEEIEECLRREEQLRQQRLQMDGATLP